MPSESELVKTADDTTNLRIANIGHYSQLRIGMTEKEVKARFGICDFIAPAASRPQGVSFNINKICNLF